MTEHFESDLHYLAATDSREIKLISTNKQDWSYENPPKMGTKDDIEDELKELATEGMNLFFNSIFSLAKAQGTVSSCTLPPPVEVLPRYKPLPQKRPDTKWEKFAKEKGIVKRKRERMVWDDATQGYLPRHGYDPAKKQREWLVELDDKDDPTVNKFSTIRKEKKLKVLKNKRNQVNNLKAHEKTKDLYGIGKDSDKKGRRAMKGKQGTAKALTQAQVSTASLGMFDKRQKGEGDVKKKKREKREDNLNFNSDEMKKRDQRILDSVLKNF